MHSLFYKLKFKYQRYAIRNLAVYASIAFAVGYLLMLTPFYGYMMFLPKEVLHGQVWRIFTAFLYPPVTGGIFNVILGILIYYSFAVSVERSMGEFEFNVYFFGSFFLGEIGTLIYYLITGINAPFIPMFTQFSVFMAFAIMYAESTILLFFILPIKAKFLAVFELALYTFYFIVGNGLSRIFGMLYTRISIIAALIPVYLFYRMVYSGGESVFTEIRNYFNRRKRQKEWRDQWK